MKHLIICLDGTWSDGNAPAPQTNIAVLAGIIDPDPPAPPSSASTTTPASAPAASSTASPGACSARG